MRLHVRRLVVYCLNCIYIKGSNDYSHHEGRFYIEPFYTLFGGFAPKKRQVGTSKSVTVRWIRIGILLNGSECLSNKLVPTCNEYAIDSSA